MIVCVMRKSETRYFYLLLLFTKPFSVVVLYLKQSLQAASTRVIQSCMAKVPLVLVPKQCPIVNIYNQETAEVFTRLQKSSPLGYVLLLSNVWRKPQAPPPRDCQIKPKPHRIHDDVFYFCFVSDQY